MKKDEFIRRYGEAAWKKKVKRKNEYNLVWMKKWYAEHLTEARKRAIGWKRRNPKKVKKHDQEIGRKGGRYYEKMCSRRATGVPHEKSLIRGKHNRQYREYKKLIAPWSHIHHGWLNDGTAAYSGVALVEADAHMHGIVDVIRILEGEITLFTEKELREQQ